MTEFLLPLWSVRTSLELVVLSLSKLFSEADTNVACFGRSMHYSLLIIICGVSASLLVVIFWYLFCVTARHLATASFLSTARSRSLWLVCRDLAFLGISEAVSAKRPNVAENGRPLGKGI